MSYTVTTESFDSLAALYEDKRLRLNWKPLFITPVWLEVWWRVFGGDSELALCAVKQADEVIGIAPLMVKDGTASIIGNTDVCDYLDFVIVPDKEPEFFNIILDSLKKKGINTLNLESLRPDSTVLNYLPELALSRGYEIDVWQSDVTLEMPLPSTWDEYLETLDTKQRHEVRRKLRRLEEAGKVEYRTVGDPSEIKNAFDVFLRMFTESRTDKADFLTEKRERFFREMTAAVSAAGILKLGILEIESVPAAMIIFFDYLDSRFLYNSGYKPEYQSLSAGLMSKVMSIRESIASGKKVYDFLRGNEIYKSRLGGIEIPLSDCRINIR